MANYRVKDVSDICKEGDYVTVKVIDIDRTGQDSSQPESGSGRP